MTDVPSKVVVDLTGGKPRRMVVALTKDELAALATQQASAQAAAGAAEAVTAARAALATNLRAGKLTLEETQAALAEFIAPEGGR